MYKFDGGKFSKATILAEIIYRAIVRYTKAKKSLIGDKKSHFRLDLSRIWRGNRGDKIDRLEKQYEINRR